MGLRFVEYRRRQWVLRYRDPWSGKQRIKSFSTEGEARQFEAVQAEMHIRERELMRRAKRRMSSASATKATVAELLERYAGTLENPTTRSTTTQHAEPLTAIFGHRRAHCVTCDDVLAWCEVQRQRGVGQSTVHRRVSILRAAYGWAVRARLLLSNPLVSLRIAKPKAQRIAPPSVKEARLLYDAAAPHIQRVIVLGMATGARIGPSELFRSLALVYGADIKCVAETMGHKNITMLLSVYQHTLFEQRRRAVNAAPGLFSGTGAKRGKKKRLPPGRGKEASAFFEPAPERRAAPPHDAAASWGVAACVCAGTRAADRTDAGTPDARQPDGSGAG